MTIKQLKELFNLYPDDTEVHCFDEDVSIAVPVTGAVYSEHDGILELTTDD